MPPTPNPSPNARWYAKIAVARKQLPHMDEEAYRDMLEREFGVRSSKGLNNYQFSRLMEIFVKEGVVFTSKAAKPAKSPRPGTTAKPPREPRPHVRSDYYEIADDGYAPMKRMICAIWKRLGYDMTSLDTRCKREFEVESFAWLRDRRKLQRLLNDLQSRERVLDAELWHESTKDEMWYNSKGNERG